MAFLVGCFPPGYLDAPKSGDTLLLERAEGPRGRSTYRAGGYLIQTAPCDGEGEAEYTFDEYLRFRDGAECPVTMVYPASAHDLEAE